MGSKKTKEVTTSPQTQTVTPQALPGQQELIDIQLEKQRALSGPTTELDLQAVDLISSIFAGQPLEGNLAELSEGINPLTSFSPGRIDPSEGILGEEAISSLASKAVGDIRPFFQQQGILDSGTALEVSGNVAGDIRRQVAESNLQRRLAIREGNIGREQAQSQFETGTEFSRQGFNIGNLFNLLNLGVGGQAQVQQPSLTQSSQLARSFAGLQPVTTATSGGTINTTSTGGGNPFLNAIGTGLGAGIGAGGVGALSGFFSKKKTP